MGRRADTVAPLLFRVAGVENSRVHAFFIGTAANLLHVTPPFFSPRMLSAEMGDGVSGYTAMSLRAESAAITPIHCLLPRRSPSRAQASPMVAAG